MRLTSDAAQEPDLKQDESAAGALIEPHPLWVRGDAVEILDGLAVWDAEPT